MAPTLPRSAGVGSATLDEVPAVDADREAAWRRGAETAHSPKVGGDPFGRVVRAVLQLVVGMDGEDRSAVTDLGDHGAARDPLARPDTHAPLPEMGDHREPAAAVIDHDVIP